MILKSGRTVKITESGKYLLFMYTSGIREGGGFSYWIIKKGYPQITNSSINTINRIESLETSTTGIAMFTFLLDIQDPNGATFTMDVYPGSTGGANTGWIKQLIKLEQY